MKRLSLGTLLVLLYSCSSSQPSTLTDKVESSLSEYYKQFSDDSGSFDSLQVLSIDSISQKEAYQFKLSYYEDVYVNKDNIWKNLNDVYIIGQGSFDKETQRMSKERADAAKREVELITRQYADALISMKDMDSITPMYYLSTIKAYGKDRGSYVEFETQVLLTKSVVVITPENL